MTNTSILSRRRESPASKLLRRFYIIWATIWWLLGFIVLFPFFTLCIWIPRIQPIMAAVNQIWCLIFFPMAFLRVKTTGKHYIPENQPVIYCSNHGSFLDIPLLTYVLPGFPAFMGKASLGRIPVFGFMFRNLHIVVERGSTQGRIKALKQSRKLIRKGRSIIVFPEGSIHSRIQPGLADFKDGAFKLAIQTRAQIVPVTICFNWFVLPDDGRWLPNFYYCKTIIHPPIQTAGLEETDWSQLKEQTFDLINKSLVSENEPLVKQLTHEH